MRNASTRAAFFRKLTISKLCLVSRFFVSLIPGVSITMTGSSWKLLNHLVSTASAASVFDSVPGENSNLFSPHKELPVLDLPLPVRPIKQTILNFFSSSSASIALLNSSIRSPGAYSRLRLKSHESVIFVLYRIFLSIKTSFPVGNESDSSNTLTLSDM